MTFDCITGKNRLVPLTLFFVLTAFPGTSAFAAGDAGLMVTGTERSHGSVQVDPDYAAALQLIKQDKYAEALPYLEAALRKTPDHGPVQADYVLCLVWTAAYQQAADFYTRHETKLKAIGYVARNSGKAFYELGNYDKARLLYEQALLHDISDREALKGIVFSLCHLRNFSRAHQVLRQYARIPTVEPAYLTALQLHVYEHEGNYKKAYILSLQLLQAESDEAAIRDLMDKKRTARASLSGDEIDALLREQQENPLHDMIAVDGERYAVLITPIPSEKDAFPLGALLDMAWGNFKSQRDDEALGLYRLITQQWPDSCLARINIVYPLSRTGQFEQADAAVQKAKQKRCFYADTLFAEAFLNEKRGDFLRAAHLYDELLRESPNHDTARRLKMRSLADLGLTSYAYQKSVEEGGKDEEFLAELEGNSAVHRLQWKEAGEAIPLLEKQLRNDPGNFRARCDYAVALRDTGRMREVVEQYEIIKGMKREIPYWVLNAAADACLYRGDQKKAVTLYREGLNKKPPERFNLLMGLFYAYQELRDWEKSEETWRSIEELLRGGEQLKQWQRMEAVSARGWYLVSRDELEEAQTYFESYLKEAGMNTGFRAGLGHVYLRRGWPGKALEEFNIAHAIYPKDIEAESGRILALNELNHKEEARTGAEKLLREFPANKHVQDTHRVLQVEDMNEFSTETRFLDENEGATEYWVKTTVLEPVRPTLKLFQEVIWQETSEEDTPSGKEEFEWKRGGIGDEWIMLPQLTWKQALTFDIEEFEEFGYYTLLTFRPTDQLSIATGYDSFYLDIPLRARAKGVEGESTFLNVHYHQSEKLFYGASTGYTWYDDGNLNVYYKLYYDRSAVKIPDFEIRLGAELYHSRNRESHEEYFSPGHDLSLTLTPALYWIHLLRNDKEVRSSLYPRLGVYRQNTYAWHTIGGATYEHLIRMSRTFEVAGGISWDRKIYDGESTNVWGGFFRFKKNF